MRIVCCLIYPRGVFVYTLDEAPNQEDTMCAAESQIGPAETSLPDDAASGHGYMSEKAKYLARMRRIEGQARGIHRMIDEDTYCIDILTQISAVTSALENLALGLLDDHLKHCVSHAINSGGDDAQEKIREASAAIQRLVKS